MKANDFTQHRRRALAAAMVLSLVWLTTGCDSPGWSPREEENSLDIAIQENSEGLPQQFVLVLVAEYETSDEGMVIEGNALTINDQAEWHGYRILKGKHGTVVVEVQAAPETANGNAAEGTWVIRGGTDKYAGLEGAGKFVAKSDGNGGFAESLRGCCNGLH